MQFHYVFCNYIHTHAHKLRGWTEVCLLSTLAMHEIVLLKNVVVGRVWVTMTNNFMDRIHSSYLHLSSSRYNVYTGYL